MPSPSRSLNRSPSQSARDSDHHHHHHRHQRSRHGHSHSHRHRHRDGTRSRSPHRSDRHRSDRHYRREDRERERERDRERHARRERPTAPAQPAVLPFQARELSRRDIEVYEPMFAMYLDIQKGLLIEDLPEDEAKGRWKSFIRKWNRGELAEGWYDPATLERARQSVAQQPILTRGRPSPDYGRSGAQAEYGDDREVPTAEGEEDEEEEEEEEEYGPRLPQPNASRGITHSGPTIPNTQDLELRRETALEDAAAARGESRQAHRSEVRAHKAAMRHLEDEVAPRAEPGTRERQLERRQEAAAANRSFAEARRGGSPEGAPEEELMGSGENDLAALRREKEKEQRKKNERELRREEILRARAAEREERIQQYREKEQETIGWLQALAKQRFG